MKWNVKAKSKKTEWFTVFAWLPVTTENHIGVWLEKVEKRYKVHMSGGEYVYRVKVL